VDERISWEDWKMYIKETTKWGWLPVLTIDEKTELGQTETICRYLARQYNLIGEDEIEAALVDEIAEATDVHHHFQEMCYAKTEQKKAEATRRFIEINLTNISNLEAIKQSNGGDWLVGRNLTWADLIVASLYSNFSSYLDMDLLAGFPNLKAHQAAVFAIPQIKAWIKKRPVTEF